MTRPSPREASYSDLEALAPEHVVAQTFAGDDPIRAEPFDAIELELGPCGAADDVVTVRDSRSWS